jgi:hypothetical protein
MANSDHNGHGHIPGTPRPSFSGPPDHAVTYEQSDVQIKGIVIFVVGLALMTVGVYVLMLLMFNVMNQQEASKEQETKQSPMTQSEKDRLPPEPRLQEAPGFGVADANGNRVDLSLGKPQDEYQAVRSQWDEVLRLGPKDKSGKAAGMPIDEALKKVLEGNSLSARTPEGTSIEFWDYATQTPSAASAGRMTERRKQ